MDKASVVGVLVGGLALGAVLGAGTMQAMAKKNGGGSSGSEALTCSATGGPTTVTQALFTLDGKNYTQMDLPLEIQADVTRIQNQAYQQLSGYMKELAVRIALAKEKNKDLAKLPPLAELLDGGKVDDAQVNAILEAQKKNLPAGMSIDEAKRQITAFLSRNNASQVVEQKLAQLEDSGKFKLLLNPPVARPLETEGFPFKGSKDAKVKLTIVTDFLCGHCRHRGEEFNQVMNDFADRAQISRVVIALNPTGLSGTLARGAYCATKMNPENYWKYHDGAEKVPLEAARSVSPDAKKEFNNHALGVAKDSGYDVAEFEKCIDSREAEEFVNTAAEKSGAAGVSGTPAFFLNGQQVMVAPGKLPQIMKDALAAK